MTSDRQGARIQPREVTFPLFPPLNDLKLTPVGLPWPSLSLPFPFSRASRRGGLQLFQWLSKKGSTLKKVSLNFYSGSSWIKTPGVSEAGGGGGRRRNGGGGVGDSGGSGGDNGISKGGREKGGKSKSCRSRGSGDNWWYWEVEMVMEIVTIMEK